MPKQHARQARTGGEGSQAAVEQLLRLLQGGTGRDRYPLIARKAQVALRWARPGAGQSNVDWLCGQFSPGYARAIRAALRPENSPTQASQDQPAQTAATPLNTGRKARRQSRQSGH